MNISGKKRILIICAYLASAVSGLGGFATPVSAQNAVTPPAIPSAAVLADGKLAKRVQAALHDDPYFYDEHVTVSVEQGAVVLRGFVFSSSDLLDAIRIARNAAGDRRVVDNLLIERNGQSGRH
jgi:osmotically-inducible protein OsmY